MTTLQALPLPSNFEDLCELFLLYIAYSTLGWCGEMLYCSIPKGHICEKRVNAFDVERFIRRKMKVKADTVTDVYEVDAEENGDELSLE